MAGKKRLSKLSERLSEAGERLSAPGEGLNTLGERRREPGPARAGDGARLLCAGSDLADGGDGIRFEIERKGEAVPAFAIRHGGRVYAYLNRCAHIAMELDWNPGKFFDTDGEYLICSTHGALYAPDSGACRGGPCRGAGLTRLPVFENDGQVYLSKD
jgi:nitrite reductase/ring-hydroxylating ferredoxin subunit